jgi:hypothetical protein
MLSFPAEGSELPILLVLLIIIYKIISFFIKERKLVKKGIDILLEEAESIESDYGKISKAYYWILPDRSFKRILILKRSKKVIFMDSIIEYSILRGLTIKKVPIINKGLFKKKKFINEYKLEFRYTDGLYHSYPYFINLRDNDKVYSNPRFIRSNRKRYLSAEYVVNEIEGIISEVVRRERKH